MPGRGGVHGLNDRSWGSGPDGSVVGEPSFVEPPFDVRSPFGEAVHLGPIRRHRSLESIPVRRHCSLEPVHAPILPRGDAEQEPGEGKDARQLGTDHRPYDRESVRVHAGERSIVSAPSCAVCARRESGQSSPRWSSLAFGRQRRPGAGGPLTGAELANLSGEREAVMLASTWR